MRAILEVNGWKKIADISNRFIQIGSVEISIEPPIDVAVRASDQTTNDIGGTIVRLYYHGSNSKGVPLFKYEI